MTILISVRLLTYRRNLMKYLPAEYAKHYLSLLAIIVESAALYSIVALVFLVAYAFTIPSAELLITVALFAQVRRWTCVLS